MTRFNITAAKNERDSSFFAIICLGFGVAFSTVATILTNDERFTGPVWVPGLSGSMFLLGAFFAVAVDAKQRLIVSTFAD
jgi:hypothetical protein